MLRKLAGYACGLLGLVWFLWTPKTGEGIPWYIALTAALIVLAIILAPKRERFTPHNAGEHKDKNG